MSEYLLKTKIQNNLIARKIKDAGHKCVKEFCTIYNLAPSAVGAIINFKDKPLNKDGKFRSIVVKIAEALNCDVSDLFTNHQLTLSGVTPKEISIDEAKIMQLMNSNESCEPIAELENDIDSKKLVTLMLENSNLTPRERKIIEERYMEDCDVSSIGKRFEVGGARIRQIEAKAFRKIRFHAKKQNLEI